MLSYRHAFHAGNHADVLKHAVLLHCLNYLKKKDAPFLYVDTHAGAGAYKLNEGYATKKQEYKEGVSKLLQEEGLPSFLNDYCALVKSFNNTSVPEVYPGSPLIAKEVLRHNDQLRLHELHPTDFELLQQNFESDHRATVIKKDGLRGMIRAFPPPSRRALVLIDPPYKIKNDYHVIPYAIDDALFKFKTAIILIWYPMLNNRLYEELKNALSQVYPERWLNVELTVNNQNKGMFGSGLWVINPPWDLPSTIESSKSELPSVLGQDESAALTLDFVIP